MAKKTKTLGVNLPVPQNREDAVQALRDIGEANRQIARIEADMNDQMARLKAEAEKQATPLKEKVAAQTEGLKVWAEANRDALTAGGRTKTADLGTGKVSWRLRPPSVRITGADRVIEAIKKLGFSADFLRTKEEVNKEALLADPDRARMIAGVGIGTAGEDFIVEPFEADISAAVELARA
ncbi:host-nuclease inhibitor Gam family protein [Phyllobacterium leguminum]|uniref:Phage host-nuclease inhibitor protein Gam n=1 Tax=Phyllobacterium leguminum TaxID=314237 RepID=A0A318T1D7_9HYPH|nr:host-nuclease inhibitor Gam family protein [Phyllobacterium leguminum]PYE87527.1 phage host-nuclease inhibitor protein Gam [Phyllobacterium leguminum]